MSSSNMSEKDNVGQKPLRYQAMEDDVLGMSSPQSILPRFTADEDAKLVG